MRSPRPAYLPSLSDLERRAAGTVHAFLILVTVLVPVSGYVISTSAGAGVDLFGLLTVPALLPKSDTLRDAAIQVHFYLAYGGLGLVGLHVSAALKHHLVDRDETLKRML